MSMCVHDIAAAATADAMATVYECGNIQPDHPKTMQLINSIYMEIVCVLEDYQEEMKSA